jgi:hypothetical protein
LNIQELKIKAQNFVEQSISNIDITGLISLLTNNKIYFIEIKNGKYLVSLIVGLLLAILIMPVVSTILITIICYIVYQYNKINNLN